MNYSTSIGLGDKLLVTKILFFLIFSNTIRSQTKLPFDKCQRIITSITFNLQLILYNFN